MENAACFYENIYGFVSLMEIQYVYEKEQHFQQDTGMYHGMSVPVHGCFGTKFYFGIQ